MLSNIVGMTPWIHAFAEAHLERRNMVIFNHPMVPGQRFEFFRPGHCDPKYTKASLNHTMREVFPLLQTSDWIQ